MILIEVLQQACNLSWAYSSMIHHVHSHCMYTSISNTAQPPCTGWAGCERAVRGRCRPTCTHLCGHILLCSCAEGERTGASAQPPHHDDLGRVSFGGVGKVWSRRWCARMCKELKLRFASYFTTFIRGLMVVHLLLVVQGVCEQVGRNHCLTFILCPKATMLHPCLLPTMDQVLRRPSPCR